MKGFGSISWSVSELQSLSLELSYVPRPGNMPIHLSPLYPLLITGFTTLLSFCLSDSWLEVLAAGSQDICSFFLITSVSSSDEDNFLLVPLPSPEK